MEKAWTKHKEDEIPMQLLAVHVDRSNREDHKKTDHDSHFSEWKLLVGPHDWKNGEGGAVTRYRLENLPKSSGTGIYELAVCKLPSRDRHGKLEPDLVVYLGKAENIRARLQQHGRDGTHLCGKNGFGENGCPLFDIFARGYSITYRWAPDYPVRLKISSEKEVSVLLSRDKNQLNGGWKTRQMLGELKMSFSVLTIMHGIKARTVEPQLLEKLDKRASNLTKLANFSKKHLPSLQKQVGIKIKASKLVSDDNEFGKYKNGENHNFLLQVFNFSRSRPRLVLNHGGSDENETFSCGVVLDDGSISKRPPVEGRKRCSEHKGKKTTGSSTRSSMKSQPHKEDYPEIEHCSPICGVAMDDGSVCRRQPVPGRKRCDLHKGRRIYSSDSVITRYQTMPYAVFNSYSDEKASVFYENHTGMTIPTLVFGPSHAFDLPAMVLPAREQSGSSNPSKYKCQARSVLTRSSFGIVFLTGQVLKQYILKTNVYPREPSPLKELREVTAKHPWNLMSTAPDSGQIMGMLLKLINAKKTIEIGVYTGYSLLLTALSIPHDAMKYQTPNRLLNGSILSSMIIAIDPNKETYEIGLPIIQKAGVEHKINFIESQALPVLDKLLQNLSTKYPGLSPFLFFFLRILQQKDNEGIFDFAFVDADKENYLNYHERLLKLVKVGGLIVFDNTLWGGTVAQPEEAVSEDRKESRRSIIEFNNSVSIDQRIEIALTPSGDGLTICRRIR
ncbi:hypothetical protein GOBAR_DD25028 [Gossypium barbadense]|nr:hypothetical protein GOBAR_DD25028 [Gossypium barbadense]